MIYKISSEAAFDLEKIWLYTIDNWSVQQANRYLNLIFEEINFLTLNPFAGDNFGHVRKGYFRSKDKSHLIFYRIDEKKQLLEIIRILHIQMDVDNHLNK